MSLFLAKADRFMVFFGQKWSKTGCFTLFADATLFYCRYIKMFGPQIPSSFVVAAADTVAVPCMPAESFSQ